MVACQAPEAHTQDPGGSSFLLWWSATLTKATPEALRDPGGSEKGACLCSRNHALPQGPCVTSATWVIHSSAPDSALSALSHCLPTASSAKHPLQSTQTPVPEDRHRSQKNKRGCRENLAPFKA